MSLFYLSISENLCVDQNEACHLNIGQDVGLWATDTQFLRSTGTERWRHRGLRSAAWTDVFIYCVCVCVCVLQSLTVSSDKDFACFLPIFLRMVSEIAFIFFPRPADLFGSELWHSSVSCVKKCFVSTFDTVMYTSYVQKILLQVLLVKYCMFAPWFYICYYNKI